MSRLSKILALIVLLFFVLACNFVTQPIQDVQSFAETAQALGTVIPIETLQALPSAIASAIPQETLQALPSAFPTLEALASALPEFEGICEAQGSPAQDWKGVPIMPEATAGQEMGDGNSYCFKADTTVEAVQAFYDEKLTALGWSQPFNVPFEGEFGLMVFRKEQSSLAITVTSVEGSVVVLLVMTLA